MKYYTIRKVRYDELGSCAELIRKSFDFMELEQKTMDTLKLEKLAVLPPYRHRGMEKHF